MAEEATNKQPVTPAQPETAQPETAPQVQGGSDLDALKKQIEDLGANLKIVADTVAGQKPLAADDVKKLIAEADEAATKGKEEAKAKDEAAVAQAEAAKAAKKALREKAVEKHLKGIDESILAALPDTEDESALEAAAAKLAEALTALRKAALPDVPPANKDKADAKSQAGSTTLPDGLARFAAATKA
jgi:hypothetical protein